MKHIARIAVGGSLFALVVAGAIARADKDSANNSDKKKQQDKFCTDVTALKDDLNSLDALGPNITIHQIKIVRDQIKKDGDTATGAIKKSDSPVARQFTESVDQLNRELQQSPENLTSKEMSGRLKADVKTVKSSLKALESESGCPSAGAQEQESAQQPPAQPQSTQSQDQQQPMQQQPNDQPQQPQGSDQPAPQDQKPEIEPMH